MINNLSLVWLRRDLRLEDNAALSRACAESNRIAVIFVFDCNISSRLKSKLDQRVIYIYDSIVELDQLLGGTSMSIRLGSKLA